MYTYMQTYNTIQYTVLRTVSDSYLRLVCLQSTRAYSALEVLHIMRYINLLTYLLTYCVMQPTYTQNCYLQFQVCTARKRNKG